MNYLVLLAVFFSMNMWAGELSQKQQIQHMVELIFPQTLAVEFEHRLEAEHEFAKKKLADRKVKNQAAKQHQRAQKKQTKFFKGLKSPEASKLYQHLTANNNAAARYHALLNMLSLTSTYELVKHFLADSLSPLPHIIPTGIEVLFIPDTVWLYGNDKDLLEIAKDMNELRTTLGKSTENITTDAVKQWVYHYFFHHLRAFLANKDPDQQGQLTHHLSEIRTTRWHAKRAAAGTQIY